MDVCACPAYSKCATCCCTWFWANGTKQIIKNKKTKCSDPSFEMIFPGTCSTTRIDSQEHHAGFSSPLIHPIHTQNYWERELKKRFSSWKLAVIVKNCAALLSLLHLIQLHPPSLPLPCPALCSGSDSRKTIRLQNRMWMERSVLL